MAHGAGQGEGAIVIASAAKQSRFGSEERDGRKRRGEDQCFGGARDVTGNDSASSLERSTTLLAWSMSMPTTRPSASKSNTTPLATSRDSALTFSERSMYRESVSG